MHIDKDNISKVLALLQDVLDNEDTEIGYVETEAKKVIIQLSAMVDSLDQTITARDSRINALVEVIKGMTPQSFNVGDKVVDTSKDELVLGEVVHVYFETLPSIIGWRYVVAPLSNLMHSKHYSDRNPVLKKIKTEAK